MITDNMIDMVNGDRFLFLNLPFPTSEIIDEIKSYAINEIPTKWRDPISRSLLTDPNSSAYTIRPTSNKKIQEFVQDTYSPYFKANVAAHVGYLRNIWANDGTGRTGRLKPHCDPERYTAINFHVDLGGDNVYNNFYKEVRDPAVPLSTVDFGDESKLTFEYRLQMPLHTWHAYDVQVFHSVENIEFTRIFLALWVDGNPTLQYIKENLSEIVKQ